MSSRQEEKERRRLEREAAERAAQRSAGRRGRLTIIGGAILAIAAVAAIVVVATAGGGGGDGGDGGGGDDGGLAAAAKAAGCTFSSARPEGREHTDEKVTYKTNPPTSGSHNPVAGADGVYAPGNEPEKENWVHSLEHGRILFQYQPGTSVADVAKLRALAEEEFNDSPGYHTLLLQNNTDMPARFAAVAWTKSLACDRLTPPAQDVMRTFRKRFTDKAPEFIP